MSTVSTEVANFVSLIEARGPWVIVAEEVMDLRNLDRPNNIFVLQLLNGGGSGPGGRRAAKVYHYAIGKGECVKVADYEDELRLEELELPPRTRALSIILPNGETKSASGVIDKELVAYYRTILERA